MEMMSTERVIWMVDDDEAFRGLSGAAALDAGIDVVNMSSDEFARRAGDPLPDGAMLDGTALTGARAEEMLVGIPRIVICTGRAYKEIAETWTVHPHVRVLLKPMGMDEFQSAIRWLAGEEDSGSWSTPRPAS